MNNKDKIDNLKEKFINYSHVPFPKVNSNISLQDIKADLVLYDSHIAGLVSSYLNNGKINPKLITVDSKLDDQLSNFQPNNQEEEKIHQNLLKYKHEIDGLAIQLQELVS